MYKATDLDFYDDRGNYLKQIAPTQDDLPAFVKTAAEVTQESDASLFALVLIENDSVMKKFATADPGNTWLSTVYFMANKERLPEEAQKVAAANLVLALEAFDMNPPDALVDLADGPPTTNVVDVTGKRPPARYEPAVPLQKVAYAVQRGGKGFIPLTGVESVPRALEWFRDHGGQLEPREVREFAVKLAAAAAPANFSLPVELHTYARQEYGNILPDALDLRRMIFEERRDATGLDSIEKLAALQAQLPPAALADLLEMLDKESGMDKAWGTEIPDPWLSTLGEVDMFKEAGDDSAEVEAVNVDGASVTESALVKLAQTRSDRIREYIPEPLAGALVESPVDTFRCLSGPQQVLVARMAAELG